MLLAAQAMTSASTSTASLASQYSAETWLTAEVLLAKLSRKDQAPHFLRPQT